MIVIVVGVILMTIAAPSFDPVIRGMALNGAASELVSGLQFARSEAVRKNQPITVDIVGRTWRVYYDANKDGDHDPGEQIIRENTYTDRIQAQTNAWRLLFLPSGIITVAVPASTTLPTGICIQTQADNRYRRVVWFEARASSPVILGRTAAEQNAFTVAATANCA
jgi:Tfp pilus assembly protein FimT